jgi:hypothetical protein
MFAAVGWTMSSLQVASAAFIFTRHFLSRDKERRERRWWQNVEVERCAVIRDCKRTLSSKKLQDNKEILLA